MLSSQEEMAERRRVQENDRRVREQGGTFHQHALADAATPRGRFTQVTAENVVGSTAIPAYPAASSPWQGPDLVGQEPPTGYRIDQMIPDDPVVQQGQDGPAPDVPASPLAVERSAGSARLRRF
jgi:hypothetical protein